MNDKNKAEDRAQKREAHQRSMAIRRFIVSAVYTFLIVGILMFLTFVDIPQENKDLVNLVLGVVLAGASMASVNLFENPDDPNSELQEELDAMRSQNIKIQARLGMIHDEHTKLMRYLVDAYMQHNHGKDPEILRRMSS